MKYIIMILGIFAILIFNQCSKTEQFTVNLDGQYIGTLNGNWEKMDIKNFNTNPDTTYSGDNFKISNIKLIIDGSNYKFLYSDRINTGTLLVETDSITFTMQSTNCPDDCAEYLAGEKVKYEINQSEFKMIFFSDLYERQYNFTDKDFTKEKRVYELKKTN
jgi:hypothetical protein